MSVMLKSEVEQLIEQRIQKHMRERHGIARGPMRHFAAIYGLNLDELGKVKRGERWNWEVAECLERVLGIPKETLPRQPRPKGRRQ